MVIRTTSSSKLDSQIIRPQQTIETKTPAPLPRNPQEVDLRPHLSAIGLLVNPVHPNSDDRGPIKLESRPKND